mmetsp:Transcript_31451/g.45871  ORF Transcript_31451/g.45871 Transcript_31451/m.45871 type:complete len:191 (-) Transcript_31451:833-1405(-)
MDVGKLLFNSVISAPQARFCTPDIKDFYLNTPVTHTPGLWKHEAKDVTLCLVVDDFGIKYTNRDDMHHLITALKELYKISINWRGELFYGITLNWNYLQCWVDLSMPGYIPAALHKFQHATPKNPTFGSHPYTAPVYTKKTINTARRHHTVFGRLWKEADSASNRHAPILCLHGGSDFVNGHKCHCRQAN